MSGPMNKALLDTNVLIALLKGDEKALALIECYFYNPSISIISATELLVKSTKETHITIKSFLEAITIIDFEGIKQAERTADIRRKTGMRLPDSIIAATALLHNLTLVSFDKEFLKLGQKDWVILEYPR